MDSFVSPAYLEKETLKNIQKQLHQSIQLCSFLQPIIFFQIQKDMPFCKWLHAQEPHIHSFSTAVKITPMVAGLQTMLSSEEFLEWLLLTTGKRWRWKKTALLCFQKQDYTLQQDTQHAGMHVLFEITQSWQEQWGGYTSVVANGKEQVRIIPKPNTLTLFLQQKRMNSFVKYVNHYCKCPRFFLESMYAVKHDK